MSSENRFIAEITFHVRYAETDAMRIVHHASYIVYFEEGRSAYLRQKGDSYADFERTGYYLAVSEVGARYIKPAVYDQQVTVRSWIEEIRSRSLTFNYEIIDTQSDELLVNGFSKHICITHEGRVATLPEKWRKWQGQ